MLNQRELFRLAIVTVMTGACGAQSLAVARTDTAKDFPNKPIRFIVNSAPGGGTDITARAIAQKLSEAWGRQVIVDNRAGANGAIAIDLTAKAIPDGYTICTITAGQVVDSAINPKLPYDLPKDLASVSQMSANFWVIYHEPSLAVKSIKELIAHARANPRKLNYGAAGTGGLQHLSWELFSHMTGAKFVHVPYKGGTAIIAAMLAGEIQLGMTSVPPLRPHLSTGRLRGLAITAKMRSSVLPELPTVAEAGVPGFEVNQWYGVITSAKVSPAIVRKLSIGVAAALKSPEVVQRLAADGSNPMGSTPEQFSAHIKAEFAKWGKLAKDIGFVLN